MRLPVIGGDDSRIDEAAVLHMVDTSMKSGINYYDTAWGYHGENSELVMGKALARYPRESFYLATKFPGYDPANWSKVEEIFETQLKKLNVEYFDFYLFHNACEMNIAAYLDDERYHIYSYLMEQKRNGRIRHLGFSCHGSMPVLKRFLDAYGKDMEFCQLQLNYLDWTFQHGREKVDLLNELGIPVWVMEPLRGGRLIDTAYMYWCRTRSILTIRSKMWCRSSRARASSSSAGILWAAGAILPICLGMRQSVRLPRRMACPRHRSSSAGISSAALLQSPAPSTRSIWSSSPAGPRCPSVSYQFTSLIILSDTNFPCKENPPSCST